MEFICEFDGVMIMSSISDPGITNSDSVEMSNNWSVPKKDMISLDISSRMRTIYFHRLNKKLPGLLETWRRPRVAMIEML